MSGNGKQTYISVCLPKVRFEISTSNLEQGSVRVFFLVIMDHGCGRFVSVLDNPVNIKK
jgi:hypothetical protein